MNAIDEEARRFARMVISPGETHKPNAYDDGILFSEAVEIARMSAEYTSDDHGKTLNALREMFGAEAVETEMTRIEAETAGVSVVAGIAAG
jgi:hypothetical protein